MSSFFEAHPAPEGCFNFGIRRDACLLKLLKRAMTELLRTSTCSFLLKLRSKSSFFQWLGSNNGTIKILIGHNIFGELKGSCSIFFSVQCGCLSMKKICKVLKSPPKGLIFNISEHFF